jgi:hypothetical protein
MKDYGVTKGYGIPSKKRRRLGYALGRLSKDVGADVKLSAIERRIVSNAV